MITMQQPSRPANPAPPSQKSGGGVYDRFCAFCNTPMKSERCRECGAPIPGRKEKKDAPP